MNSKIIVKNTMYLYIRMIISSLIGLFTSRIILKQLGVVDFGIYNVVFGVVVLMGFMVSSMTVSVQRYLSYNIGLKNIEETEKVLNISVVIHIAISVLVMILAITLGLFLFDHILNIPKDRINAAEKVYGLSIIVFMISIIRVPFEALLNSYENFRAIAMLGIFESVLRLLAAYILSVINFDKLVGYSINITIISVLFLVLYILCSLNKKGLKIHFNYKFCHYKDLLSFSGWNLLGGTANMLKSQGGTIIVNFFFGAAVNAAQGIANQVSGLVCTLSHNIAKAVNPQIVQSYAQKDMNSVGTLASVSSKITSFLLVLVIIPLLLYMDKILSIWLGDYPDYTVIMTSLVLVCAYFDNLSNPIMIVYQAYGRLKKYQIIMSSIILMYLPLTFLMYKLYKEPYMCYIVAMILSLILLFSRLFMAYKYAGFNSRDFIKNVVLKMCFVFALTFVIAYFFKEVFIINNVILGGVITTFISSMIFYVIGMTKKERSMAINFIKSNI